jgi:hypothetical protein
VGALKATAEKTSGTASAARPHAARQPFFARVQTKMTVNRPGDSFEQEADKTAERVMRMPAPGGANTLQRQGADQVQRREEEKILRAVAEPRIQRREEEKILRSAAPGENAQQALEPHRAEEQILRATDETIHKAQSPTGVDGSPSVQNDVQSAIRGQMTGGEPLGADVRGFMEPRFNADFQGVRVHRDTEASHLSDRLSARAFTYKNHIFFSRNQYQPDSSDGKQLLAHELTHTIQQGQSIQRTPEVSTSGATPSVQRLGVQDALDKFADWANAIPGFRLLTLIMGVNPINLRAADRSAANLLRALIELIPGGIFITQALDNHGVIAKAATWVEGKLAELGDIGGGLSAALRTFLDSLSWTDIFNLEGVWARAKHIFADPAGRLIQFALSTAGELLKMVKDAILKPLAALAQGTRGYDLLCVLLGEDPISGEPVPRSAENLIGGFMKLIGQEEVWENIKKGYAIARAYAWFQNALGSLMGMVHAIPMKIVGTLESLNFQDIATLAGAFGKIVGTFVNIAVDFVTWGLSTVWELLKIVIDVVKPGLMGYLQRTGAALKSIVQNPMPFLGNLVKAAKLGFTNFADRIGEHLKTGIIDWLTGSLEGVYMPKAMSLIELGKFALSVLGITWAQIRGKIVTALGPRGEKIMQGLEFAFDTVRALVNGGIAAVWDLIKEKLADLKDQVIQGIISFVTDTIVKKAIPKLIGMFIPGAGFIPAIISIYDTIMVFVEKIKKIMEVVTAFIDSIVNIAAGNIGPASKRVESTLAGLLSLAISFLAGFLGLGKVTDKIMDVVKKVRAKVDAAIGAAVNWVVSRAKALFASLFSNEGPDERSEEQKNKDKQAALNEAQALTSEEVFDEEAVRKKLTSIQKAHRLKTLDLVVDSKQDDAETIHFSASASAEVQSPSQTVKVGPSGPVVPLKENSWIENIPGEKSEPWESQFEQVTSSKSVAKRVGNLIVPITFSTAVPGSGRVRSRGYEREKKDWIRTSFVHKSTLVTPVGNGAFCLRPKVVGKDIRNKFYEDSSHDWIKNIRKSALMLNATHFKSEGDPAKEQAHGFPLDVASGRAIVPWKQAHADHDPAVAKHWTDTGSKTDQANRVGWNKDPKTFKIISDKLNLELGARGAEFIQEVGINFRGPKDPP